MENLLSSELIIEIVNRTEIATGENPVEVLNNFLSKLQNKIQNMKKIIFFYNNLILDPFGVDGDFGIIIFMKNLDANSFINNLDFENLVIDENNPNENADMELKYKKKYIYFHDTDMGFFYLNKNTMILTNREVTIKKIFDVMDGAPDISQNHKLNNYRKKVIDNDFFLVSKFPPAFTRIVPLSKDMEDIIIGITLNHGVNAIISGNYKDENSVNYIEEQTKKMINPSDSIKEKMPESIKELLNQISYNRNGTLLTLEGKVELEQSLKLFSFLFSI